MGRVTARRQAATSRAGTSHRPETLVVEEPLEIRLNGTPLTVTMRTPGSDVELAQGFLLTEGVIDRPRRRARRVRYCQRCAGEDGLNTYNVLDVTLAPGVPMPDVDVTPQLLHHLVVRGLRQGVAGRGARPSAGTAPATTRRWSPPRR